MRSKCSIPIVLASSSLLLLTPSYQDLLLPNDDRTPEGISLSDLSHIKSWYYGAHTVQFVVQVFFGRWRVKFLQVESLPILQYVLAVKPHE